MRYAAKIIPEANKRGKRPLDMRVIMTASRKPAPSSLDSKKSQAKLLKAHMPISTSADQAAVSDANICLDILQLWPRFLSQGSRYTRLWYVPQRTQRDERHVNRIAHVGSRSLI